MILEILYLFIRNNYRTKKSIEIFDFKKETKIPICVLNIKRTTSMFALDFPFFMIQFKKSVLYLFKSFFIN